MRQLMIAVAVGGLMAAAAGAQWDRVPRRGVRGDVTGQVLRDLERMRSYRFVDDHERRHFEHARRDLVRFRERWRDGRFDRDRLDSAIGNLRDLAQSDQVHPRDREILRRNLYALRDFRSTAGREDYGSRRRAPGW